MNASYDKQLCEELLNLNLVPKEKLEEVCAMSHEKQIPVADILLEKDLIDDKNLGKVIADIIKVPFVSLADVSIESEVLNIIPEIVAKKNKIILFERDKNGLKIAMADPSNTEIQEFIAKKTGEKISVFYATTHDILRALKFYAVNLQKTFDDLLQEQMQLLDKEEAKEVPIAKLVDLLIEYAYTNGASDIHIEPEEEISLIRFRIDGVLHDVLHLPQRLHGQIVSRVKVLSKLRIDEHASAQDGKMQKQLEEENLDMRISIIPTTHGEKVVIRLLSEKARRFTLDELGMTEETLAKVKQNFSKPFGMVLGTGPTGCGKTTTIYGILKILNTREKNIATIEDPVEYDILGINQIQVNPQTNLTFADGLKSILRQDPDIIFVGEIRDKETAGIAINAATTGHLVLSTLHTNNAVTSLPRLLDMEIEPYLVASTVNVVVAQRLVRRICTNCRVSVSQESQKYEKVLPKELLKKYFSAKKEIRLYGGKGCNVCQQTGYKGRIGIFEVLELTEAMKDLIMAKAPADVIEKKAVEEGMKTMLEDGLEKALTGITTIEEILIATKK
ncbi:MAG TPA: GspE/PulE family protein [Patescibacteria group bacterium]